MDKLNSAIANGETKLARKSLDQHLALVSRLLGRGTELSLDKNVRVQLLVGAAAVLDAGVAADLIMRWHIVQPEVVGVMTAAGAAVTEAGLALTGSKRAVRSRRLSHALGDVVNIARRA